MINSEWAAISDAADYETSASFLLDCEFQLDSITREFEQSLNKLESYLGRNISDAFNEILYATMKFNNLFPNEVIMQIDKFFYISIT